ncbi:hypothetical protein IQ251_12980 [Saccharopolyspora sp. HNM0983]|uniref:Uncharacterized protein n=1 Tax=Saccharopolyspora montiporae TaxID=2781240 RepID=A0A929BAT9_9PSEU|nr:hypothetical protein [Saccharopolyspora sp. HNM0983]MBE9375360.1 hypothetical protein [Saccharopolyspora sp. HNM0983]
MTPLHEHGAAQHEPTGVTGVDVLGVVLRLLLFAGTALVGGIGLLRPTVEIVARRALVAASTAGAVGLAALGSSIALREVSTSTAGAHALLLLAVLATIPRRPSAAAASGALLALVLALETAGGHGWTGLPIAVLTVLGTAWIGLFALSSTAAVPERAPQFRHPRRATRVAAAVIALAGLGPLLLSDVLGDRRVLTTSYGQVLLLIAAASVAVLLVTAVLLRRGGTTRAAESSAVALVVALVASWLLPAVPPPAELPRPGTPLIAESSLHGEPVPILVTPQRPGRNLVHLPESAGEGIEVVGAGEPVRTEQRAGTSGRWAEVDLAAGRSRLTVQHAGGHGSTAVDVDTGQVRTAVTGATGPDGPECAGTALAARVAGSRDAVSSCPSQELSTADAGALRSAVGYLAARKAPAIALLGDDSPRSRQAADAVRDAAAEHRIAVHGAPQSGDAALLVSGYEAAQRRLDELRGLQGRGLELTHGVHLAPWLLNAPLANSVATASVPLRFDPRDGRALQYGMAVDALFPGSVPSVSGFTAWLRTRGQELTGPVAIYASAQVDVMKMDMPGHDMSMHGSAAAGQWNPHGTVVAISGPLPG